MTCAVFSGLLLHHLGTLIPDTKIIYLSCCSYHVTPSQILTLISFHCKHLDLGFQRLLHAALLFTPCRHYYLEFPLRSSFLLAFSLTTFKFLFKPFSQRLRLGYTRIKELAVGVRVPGHNNHILLVLFLSEPSIALH